MGEKQFFRSMRKTSVFNNGSEHFKLFQGEFNQGDPSCFHIDPIISENNSKNSIFALFDAEGSNLQRGLKRIFCAGDQRADYREKEHSVILSFFLTHDKKSDTLLNAKYWNSNGHRGVSLV
ncbi:MAG: hypothetical protein Q4B15_07110 [Lachnospiraceae bacterium]|nr:hypothetical protein [Lachnospiraceae bacterium]